MLNTVASDVIRSSLRHTWHTGTRLLKVLTFASLLPMAAAVAQEPGTPDIVLPDELNIEALYEQMAPQVIYGRTAIELLRELETKHYSTVSFDNQFAERVFDNFLDGLDSQKLYFLQEDIDALIGYRETLDDALKNGNLQPAYDIYNIYHKRVLERLVWTVNFVEKELAGLDFTIDEYLEIDRDEAPWASTPEQLDDLWRQRIKNSALSLTLTGMEPDLIEERLSKRYRNQLSQVAKTNDRDVFQAFLATVARTVDPHTSYFSPRDSENFNMGLRGSLQGIGAQLTSEDEYTKVAELIKGGPAEQAGELRAGDRIIGIGQGEDGEMQDVIGLRLDDVVDQIRGEKGTLVRLSVIPAEATSEAAAREIRIVRDTVELSEQFARSEIIEVEVEADVYQVGVITLPSFYFDFEAAAAGLPNYRSSARDVRALLEELKQDGVEAVVVDLRYNGGGSLNEANELVGLFIDTGPTVQIRYSGQRNGFVRSYGDADQEIVYDGPLAVLVNRASASASEIFAGAIQDYQRGIVLGGQTFGKGTVQEIIPMNYGQVKLTRSKFYRISGASTQHRGVLPDIEFPDRYQAIETMGESNLDGALPWDTVRPVEYRNYLPLREILPELQARHQERAAEDPDFVYLNDAVQRMIEVRQRTSIPLNKDLLKAQREADRRAEFEANNQRLQAKGLPLEVWKDEEELAAEEENAESAEIAANDTENEEEAQEEDDPLLQESGRILVDMAQLLGRPMTAAYQSDNLRAAQVEIDRSAQ
ncbi:carboxy terminal-processing peptidase [Pseudohongiella spirulinae]|uniref:Periplasmic tail-specific protease n=1 Tax=Pseudohongiella spirulinae TaxID=1249552 RepID=A0A0S2KDW7_9GAMM|nr:carboxy terminal-processing peptidase [Pseudohongiella spirulinae]ALO46191.1 Periplasmic tail-specific protease [Pseudohongiella spirulinae]